MTGLGFFIIQNIFLFPRKDVCVCFFPVVNAAPKKPPHLEWCSKGRSTSVIKRCQLTSWTCWLTGFLPPGAAPPGIQAPIVKRRGARRCCERRQAFQNKVTAKVDQIPTKYSKNSSKWFFFFLQCSPIDLKVATDLLLCLLQY